MAMNYYDVSDPDYVRGRLIGTIVRDDKGEPIYVGAAAMRGGKMIFSVAYLKDNEVADGLNDYVNIPMEQLDLTPVKLGWINHKNGAIWSVRTPVRRAWKQGTTNANTECKAENNPVQLLHLPFKNLRLTILGQYPSVEEAHKLSKKSKIKVAFSRNFCLEEDVLYYKTTEVGNKAEFGFTFKPPHTYLENILNRVLSK